MGWALQVQRALTWLWLQIQRAICLALLSDSLGIPGLYRNAPVLRIRFHSHHMHIRKLASLLQVNTELSPPKGVPMFVSFLAAAAVATAFVVRGSV